MRILTVIKQVPDSSATIKVTADGKGIETTGVKHVMNPFDEFAVEQAVQLREQGLPVEEIVTLVLGGEKATDVLRTALAMGADRGVHLDDPAFISHDELFLAEIVALAIKQQPEPFDLIITGKQAIDMDAGEFGPGLAELLGLPHIGVVASGLEATASSIKARRRVEGADEVMDCALPLLLTCEKGLVEPRYPSLPNLMKAKKKPVETLTSGDLKGFADADAGRSEILCLEPPPARQACQMVDGEPEEMARELVRLLREDAKVI
jgi:electron transfer flavoprotein beta subunit